MSQPHSVFAPGTLVDRYQVEELLGEGGMGQVYRALDPKLQRRVALKVLLPSQGNDPRQAASSMLREARAAAALDHPNAIAVFDVGEWHGGMYIAMELIRGRGLRGCIGDRSLSVSLRIRWLLDIARALGAAHKAGIVHRDVKPENVMIRDDGVLKVLDFGIARRTSAAEASSVNAATGTMTAPNAIVGTPLYMAPEQLLGEPLDGRADQFAWAVTGWELLTGELPWGPERSPMRVMVSALHAEPGSLRASVPEVPARVEAAMLRALRKRQEERFSTMEELVAAMQGEGEEVVAGPGPATADLALAPTGALTTGAAAALSAQSPALPARAGSTARSRRLLLIPAVLAAVAAVAIGIYARRGADSSLRTAASAPVPSAAHSVVVSPNPEAAAAYAEGLQGWRDGVSSTARTALQRAVALDPSCAAAHLRLALFYAGSDMPKGREHYQKAVSLRTRLDPRDLALLDASEPYLRQPWELSAWEQRLEQGLQRFGDDPDWLFFLAQSQSKQGKNAEALATLERAVAHTPGFVIARWLQANLAASAGDHDRALATLDQCIESMPLATICQHRRITLHRDLGRCKKFEDDARRAVAIEPTSALAWRSMASALFATGAPIEAVGEAMQKAVDNASERVRGEESFIRRIAFGYASADLQSAEQGARAWASSVDSSHSWEDHAIPLAARMAILDETGRTKEAGLLAQDALRRMSVWTRNAADIDDTMLFVDQQFRAGLIQRAEYDSKRKQWLDSIKAAPRILSSDTGTLEWLIWDMAWASLARTPEEAAEALKAMPADRPVPIWRGADTRLAGDAGMVLALASRSQEAIPLLRVAAGACPNPYDPWPWVRGHFYLGLALEATGDRQGARDSYQRVVDRWGQAKPESTTAKRARQRLDALR